MANKCKAPNEQTGLVLPKDQSAWLPVATAVLAGDYDYADESTVKSLRIGMAGIQHPATQLAAKILDGSQQNAGVQT